MISRDKKFLFVHVPKTGGNSIQNVLLQYSEDRKIVKNKDNSTDHYGLEISENSILHKHSTLENYYFFLGEEFYNSLFKFSVMRNPWDWCVSWYFHRNKKEWNADQFEDFIKSTPTFVDYLTIMNKRSPLMSKILRKMPFKSANKAVAFEQELNFILKFENLRNDFSTLTGKLDLPDIELPHVNKSDHEPYSNYYNNKTKEIVRRRFSREIEYAGYDFNNCD